MNPRGFTLVEMLVALMVFGMIAGAGTALLTFGARAQVASGARFDTLAALAGGSALLEADLAQAVDRPARDRAGVLLPAFTGERGGAGLLLRLTRGGWTNLDSAPRPSLQRVEYRLAGDTIERIAFPALDGAAPLPAAPLIRGVSAVRARYRIAGAWSDRWDGANGAALPQAMELVIERAAGGRVRQLFLVGAGAAPQPRPVPVDPAAAS